MFNFKSSAAMLLSSFAIIIIKKYKDKCTKQKFIHLLTPAFKDLVRWPFDSRWATSYEWSIVTMRLSCTVMEIWRLKCWTHARTDGRSADFILYPVLCIALDKQKLKTTFYLINFLW